MKDDDFRQQDDEVSDRTEDGPVQNGARAIADGLKNAGSVLWDGVDNHVHGKEAGPSRLGSEGGLDDLPPVRGDLPTVKGIKSTIRNYADGGAIAPEQAALYGAPLGDNTGSAVNPMISTSRGGAASENASPRMGFADGGAIPMDDDDDSDDSSDSDVDAQDADPTTLAFSQALKAVNAGLMFGRQKHGLPTGQGSSEDGGEGEMAFAEGGAVPPDDNELAFYGQDRADVPIDMDERLGSLRAPPDDNSDNSGAAPVAAIPDDNSGAAPVVDRAPQAQSRLTPLAYLMGTDAVPPEVLDQYKQGELGSENDRNLAAVDKAYGENGPGGAFGVIQALRRKFDLFMNHGRAAVDAGDYASAAKSAEQALNHLPDGNNVSFAPSKDGLVARLQGQGGNQPTTIPLSRAAADAFMNTGMSGQFDALLEGGVQSALQNVTRGTGYIGKGNDALAKINSRAGSQVRAATGGGSGGEDDDQTPLYRPNGPDPANGVHPKQVRVMNGRRTDTYDVDPKTGLTSLRETTGGRSARGGGDGGLAKEKLRQDALDRREKMRGERGDRTSAARSAVEERKLAAALDRMGQAARTAQERNAVGIIRDKVRSGLEKLTPYEDELMKRFLAAGDPAAARQPSGQTQQPASPKQPPEQPPVQGARKFNGQWYIRGPNNEPVPYQG